MATGHIYKPLPHIMKKTLQILILILITTGCITTREGKIEGFVLNEGRFENCIEKMANPNFFYYQDTIEKFKIKLHRDWWLEKSETENNYGFTTVDSSLNQNETRLIAVSVIPRIKTNLKEYVFSEIKSLNLDSTMLIQRIGKHQIDSLDSYWLNYKANDTLKINGILNYLKDNESDRIFIIHSIVIGDNEIDKRLCHLQNLTMTFRVNDE